jgi:hypothetical protein
MHNKIVHIRIHMFDCFHQDTAKTIQIDTRHLNTLQKQYKLIQDISTHYLNNTNGCTHARGFHSHILMYRKIIQSCTHTHSNCGLLHHIQHLHIQQHTALPKCKIIQNSTHTHSRTGFFIIRILLQRRNAPKQYKIEHARTRFSTWIISAFIKRKYIYIYIHTYAYIYIYIYIYIYTHISHTHTRFSTWIFRPIQNICKHALHAV